MDSIRYLPSDYPITGKFLGYNRILNKLDIRARDGWRLKPDTRYPDISSKYTLQCTVYHLQGSLRIILLSPKKKFNKKMHFKGFYSLLSSVEIKVNQKSEVYVTYKEVFDRENFLFVKYLLAVLPYILTFTIYLLAFSFIRNEHLVFFV